MFEEQYRRDNEKLHAREASFMEIQEKLREERKKEKRRTHFVRYGAMAAAILLVVGSTMGILIKEGMIGKRATVAMDAAAPAAGVTEAATVAEAATLSGAAASQSEEETAAVKTGSTVTSYDELYDLITSIGGTAYRAGTDTWAEVDAGNEAGLAMAAPIPEPKAMASSETAEVSMASAADTGTGATGAYSETNVQVAGVDEADIVKTDGEYIYYIVDSRLFILKADGADTALVSATEFGDRSDWWMYASEMYLLGDRLMIISEGSSIVWVSTDTGSFESNQAETVSTVFDISDRSNPKELFTLGQSGSYVSSRRIGDTVYTVTTQHVYNIVRAETATYVPRLISGDKSEPIAVSDIYVYDNPKDTAYTVVSGFDLKNGVRQTSAKAVFGGAGSIYANEAHLLVAVNEYSSDTTPIAPDEEGRNVQITRSSTGTKLMLFALDAGNVTRLAQGRVDGTLVNQFAMDEYEDVIRVVTTVNNWEERIYTDGVDTYEYEDETYNCLYTLDAELEIVGRLENLAEDEWVESVRFDGEIAYFVTFRQMDPLFTVDLSDPAKPKVLGALKIPGFSEYLHVYGKDRLFGLGYHADEENGWTQGVKLTMFDTHRKADVTEKTTLRLDADYTMVGQNHKAILIDAERDLIAFPADSQYYIFGFSDEKGFYEKAVVGLETNDWSWNMRGLFVGDEFYVLNETRVLVLSLDGFNKLASVKLP